MGAEKRAAVLWGAWGAVGLWRRKMTASVLAEEGGEGLGLEAQAARWQTLTTRLAVAVAVAVAVDVAPAAEKTVRLSTAD